MTFGPLQPETKLSRADQALTLISVLLPCHNCASTLPGALDSLLEQTFTDFEILAVNNGSTDHTGEVLRTYAAKDPRLRILRLEQAGIVSALNYGLRLARGQFIARMDADDISLPDRLEKQVHCLQISPHIGLVGGHVVHEDGPAASPGRTAYVQWHNSLTSVQDCALHRFVECPLAHPTFMFRREVATRFGGYRSGPFPEDYELVLRWAENRVGMGKILHPVLIWRDSPTRLSRLDPRYLPSAMYALKSPFLARWLSRHNPHHPYVVILGAGRESRKRVSYLEQEGIRITAFADIQARKIGQKIQGRRVISVHDLPPPGRYFCLSYVGQRGMGSRVSAFLHNKGYILGRDFLLAA